MFFSKETHQTNPSEDEKLKMITGEWTDEEPEDMEEHIADDSKPDEVIAEEEEIIVERAGKDGKDQVVEDVEVKDENVENVKENITDGENLASPLKQELMEFLGMDTIDENISNEKEAANEANCEQKEEDDIEEQIKDEVEQTVESTEDKSTAEEVEDELAQLRKEMESNKNEEKGENEGEEKPVQEVERKEISDSDLQEQLETDEKVESSDEPLPQKTELISEETKNPEEAKDQSKDALKSIITDWADEGEGQDDDL